MDEPLSDVVNDIGGAHEPEFTSVAVCVGADLDGNPITLLDRLCLNRPAVEKVIDDMSMCEQQLIISQNDAELWRGRHDHLYDMATASGITNIVLFAGLVVLAIVQASRNK